MLRIQHFQCSCDNSTRHRQTWPLQWRKRRWSLLWVSVSVTKERFSQHLPCTQAPVGWHWSYQSCKLPLWAVSDIFSLLTGRWTLPGKIKWSQEDGCRVDNQGLSRFSFISYPLLNLDLIRWDFISSHLLGVSSCL